MTSQSHDASPQTSSFSLGRACWTLGLLLMGIGLCLIIVFIMRQQAYRREFEKALQTIRDAGEPLDGAEMNKFYAIPAGSADLTQPYLLVIQEVHRKLQEQRSSVKLPSTLGGSIPAEGVQEDIFADAETILRAYEDDLAKLHELAHTPGHVRYPVDFTKGMHALLEYLTDIRSAARLLQYVYAVRANAKDWAGANDSLFAMVKLNNTLQNEPVFVSHLVRIVTLDLATKNITEHLSSGEVPAQKLAQLQEALEQVDLRAGLQLAYMGERVFVFQTFNNSNFQDLQGLQEVNQSSVAQGLLTSFGRHISDARPGDCAKCLEFLTAMVNAAKPDFPDCLKETFHVSKELKTFSTEEQKQMLWDRNILTGILLPALDRIPPTTATVQAEVNCAITAITLERYRLANGQFPDKLEKLVPDLLSRVPVDPFTGAPLIYQVKDNEYKLYSVGKDGLDDQGDIGNDKSPDVGLKISIMPK